jgi:hypothetical protein
MREAMAIASIAILSGIIGANANNTQTDQNVLQVAQSKWLHPRSSKGLHPSIVKRLHPSLRKRLHPALTGAYR